MVVKTSIPLVPGSCSLAGTRIQALAWELASPHITDYITLAVTTPDNQRHWITPSFRGRLSLADAIPLVHRLGLVNAAEIVTDTRYCALLPSVQVLNILPV